MSIDVGRREALRRAGAELVALALAAPRAEALIAAVTDIESLVDMRQLRPLLAG